MKAISAMLLSMGIVGIGLYFLLVVGIIGITIYGLYLAFSASVILGIIVFFVEPSPFLIGLVMILCHKNLAQMLVDFLTK